MAHEVPRRAASAGPVRVLANTLPNLFSQPWAMKAYYAVYLRLQL